MADTQPDRATVGLRKMILCGRLQPGQRVAEAMVSGRAGNVPDAAAAEALAFDTSDLEFEAGEVVLTRQGAT